MEQTLSRRKAFAVVLALTLSMLLTACPGEEGEEEEEEDSLGRRSAPIVRVLY